VEACVDTVASSRAAVRAGAGRLELCAALSDGGTTPSAGTIAAVKAAVDVPVVVLVRPRGGSFVHDASEIDVMRRDIAHACDAGADGVSLGVLAADGTIDAEAMARCVEAAGGRPVTCHRAFDATPDPFAALETLRALGVARILTSGGGRTAWDGAATLAALVRAAGPALTIVAGGGVRAGHVAALVRASGVSEVHLWGAHPVHPMHDAARPLPLRTALPSDPRAWLETDEDAVRAVVQALAALDS
jgi:copper homeostasis protein